MSASKSTSINMEYNERLKKLKMPTLKYRRMRGDMIEVFKITKSMMLFALFT
jgi:hypothetical protein